MARAAKTAVAVAKPSSKNIALVDQELSNEALALRGAIGGPAGNQIKIDPTGAFLLPNGEDLGDEIQLVVLDFMSKNMLYVGAFDRNNPVPPICYAADKIIANMAPVPESPQPQAENCGVCPMNVFGSGNGGKSKACKNTRALAVLLVNPNDPEEHNQPDAPIYTMSLPPTNIRAFDGVVQTIRRLLNGPPIKAIITVRAKNAGTYALASFSDSVPNPNYAQHFGRRGEALDLLNKAPDFNAQPRTPARNNRPAAAPRRAPPAAAARTAKR